MMFCQDHWDRLRDKIAAAGLSALVAESSDELLSKAMSQSQSGPTVDNFEPLMAAHWAIVMNLANVAGPGGLVHIMTMADCPLCHANAAHAAHCTDGCGRGDYFDDYLDFAVADQVAAWKRLGDDG